MSDFKVSCWSVLSCVLWLGSIAVILTAFGLRDANMGDLGIVMSVAAATVTIRGFLARQRRLLRAAFHLGEEESRQEAPVRSVR